MLLFALAATLLCGIWIALDSGTTEVFVVYGRMLPTVWQMKAWSALVSCGWRLALIIGVIVLNLSLAYQAVWADRANVSFAAATPWAMAVLLAIGLVPWTFLMGAHHERRWVNSRAIILTDAATQLLAMPDLTTKLEPAEYTNEPGWVSWHPNSQWHQSPEGKKLWNLAVPVVYTSTELPRTVVIPIDWENFCVWGGPPSFAHSGELLPFNGPGTARFRATPSIRRLTAAENCWIVQSDFEFTDDPEACDPDGQQSCPGC